MVTIIEVSNIGHASRVYFTLKGLEYSADQRKSDGAIIWLDRVTQVHHLGGGVSRSWKSISMKSERAAKVVAALVATQAAHLAVIE